MSQIYSDKNKYWVGDKDPRLTEFLPIVKSLYSMAIVVNIIRDPRDVLVSKKQAHGRKVPCMEAYFCQSCSSYH